MDFFKPIKRLGKPMPGRIVITKSDTVEEKIEDNSCGLYEKNAKLSAKLIIHSSTTTPLNSFYFKTETLTMDQKLLLKSTCEIRISTTNALMYSARPYKVNLNDSLLYRRDFQDSNYIVLRCKVMDLFTINVNDTIEMRAKIFLIDEGKILSNVSFQFLYEYPQRIGYYSKIEPAAKACRLHLGDPFPIKNIDRNMNDYFYQITSKYRDQSITVQILDYKDEIYYIDIINPKNLSIIGHMRQKYIYKIVELEQKAANKGSEDGSNDDSAICDLTNTTSQMKLSSPSNGNNKTELDYLFYEIPKNQFSYYEQKQPLKHYSGSLDYFATNYRAIKKENEENYMKNRFFRVKVISWLDPESIYIIPDDPEYIKMHAEFKFDIGRYLNYCKRNYTEEHANKPYSLGEKCLFRFDCNPNYGDWLRGIIIEVPMIDPDDGFYSFTDTDDKKSGLVVAPNQIYKVQSIDYGFSCIRGPANLKHIINDTCFRKGSWSIRCKLFGIKPLYDKLEHSELCLNMMDLWFRERVFEKTPHPQFYVLFRSTFDRYSYRWQTPEPTFYITLFYRYEPPKLLEDCIITTRKRKTRYDCLNTDIIDRGLAQYSRGKSKSSNVHLDHHLVNLLVPHDKI